MQYILLGLILSVIYSILVLPLKTGQSPYINFTVYPLIFKGMIYIPISSKKCIHVHHWIIFLGVLFFYNFISHILSGFSLGLCLQGLLYNDAFVFIVDNPYNKKK